MIDATQEHVVDGRANFLVNHAVSFLEKLQELRRVDDNQSGHQEQKLRVPHDVALF